MKIEEAYRKANACAEAWHARYGTDPAAHKHAILRVMAVALHETQLGDAWNNSGNWGAVQRRRMTPGEQALVRAGKTPAPRDPFEQIHGDSSPTIGRYAVWFWAFPAGVATAKGQSGDVAGADKLLEVLLDERAAIKTSIDTISIGDLATRMHASGYYEGSYDPRATYERGADGKWRKLAPDHGSTGQTRTGAELDIGDYNDALTRATATLEPLLAAWTPGATPPPPETGSVLWTQAALNRLGASPMLAEDGIDGPKTIAALQAYQERSELPRSGRIDSATIASLIDDLARADELRA